MHIHDLGKSCCICMNTGSTKSQGEQEELLITCKRCEQSVHPSCYGNPLIRNKHLTTCMWECESCCRDREDIVCVLCGNGGRESSDADKGMMKRTVDNRWAHMVCAEWLPSARSPFVYTLGREPINIYSFPSLNQQLTTEVRDVEGNKPHCCIYCTLSVGVLAPCAAKDCSSMFHATCGLNHSPPALFTSTFTATNTPLANVSSAIHAPSNDSSPVRIHGFQSSNKRIVAKKSCYCDKHA